VTITRTAGIRQNRIRRFIDALIMAKVQVFIALRLIDHFACRQL